MNGLAGPNFKDILRSEAIWRRQTVEIESKHDAIRQKDSRKCAESIRQHPRKM
jgi:hypothetical protein